MMTESHAPRSPANRPAAAGRSGEGRKASPGKIIVMAVLIVVLVVLAVMQLRAGPRPAAAQPQPAVAAPVQHPLTAVSTPPRRLPQDRQAGTATGGPTDVGPIERDPFVISALMRQMLTKPSPEPETKPEPEPEPETPPPPRVTPEEQFAADSAEWRLSGTVVAGTERLAIINGEYKRPGEKLGDYVIESIGPDSVTVRKGSFRGTISMR